MVPSKGSIAVILGFVGTGRVGELYRWGWTDRVPSKGSIAVILGFVGTGRVGEMYRWEGDREVAF
jgi:ABC-type phosphate/phosphonate transport system permease subunit